MQFSSRTLSHLPACTLHTLMYLLLSPSTPTPPSHTQTRAHTHTHTHTHTQNEELQRSNWRLSDENNKLNAKLMDDDHSSMISRRPGDGGSGEASARESIASDQPFQRNSFRQSYHGERLGSLIMYTLHLLKSITCMYSAHCNSLLKA